MKNALSPIFAAIGGMIAPALIDYLFNIATPTQAGNGIPMGTDIAFVLGFLGVVGNRIPASLKVFNVAFPVMDDLGAIVVIAFSSTAQLSIWYLSGALVVWFVLFALLNTGILVSADWTQNMTSLNSPGIVAGLIAGKPMGVIMLCYVAVASGICRLPYS